MKQNKGVELPRQLQKQYADAEAGQDSQVAAPGNAEAQTAENNPPLPESVEQLKEELARQMHKYDVLSGKYRAEVQRLIAENRQLKEQAGAPASQPAADNAGTEQPIMQRLDAIEARIDDLDGEFANRRQREFEQQLDSAIGIEELNKLLDSEEFGEWLEAADEASGAKRADILEDAVEAMDAKAVKKLYDAFTAETAGQDNPAMNKASLQSPSRGRQASIPAENKKYSAREFKEKSLAFTKGLIRPQDYNAYKKEFDRALSEGRVID